MVGTIEKKAGGKKTGDEGVGWKGSVVFKLLFYFDWSIEIDFSRKTVVETNGSGQPTGVKSSLSNRKESEEFKSVTGGFLEEVVSLISLKGADSTDK